MDKRESQEQILKEKEKKKKGESSSTSALERNMLYLTEDKDQKRYKIDFLFERF